MFNFIEGMGVDRRPRLPEDKACNQPGGAVARWAAGDSVPMTCAEREVNADPESSQTSLGSEGTIPKA